MSTRATRQIKPKSKKPVAKAAVATTPFWYSWRHIAAYIYLFICFFDFVGMPVYYEIAHSPLSDIQMFDLMRTLAPEQQIDSLRIISMKQRWEPLTLGESGLFHLAFGAILGVAAWTRGGQRSSSSRRGYFDSQAGGEYNDDHDDFEFEPEPDYSGRGRGRGRGRSSTETEDGLDPFADNGDPI